MSTTSSGHTPSAVRCVARWLPILSTVLLAVPVSAVDLPKNLAADAQATASSEYNDQYLAKFATDGRIPPAGSHAEDRGAARRCVTCHEGGKIPRSEWTRITEPELNQFLLAPLAKSAGGNRRCGSAVFADKSDPDYQALLATFEPTTEMLQRTPRIDMPGGVPAAEVCRDCQ